MRKQQLVIKAINNLPEVERAVVLEISSMALRKDLDYIGLEECGVAVFATYLRDAAFISDSQQERRDDDFESLLVTAMERSDAGTLDLTLLIDFLCEPSYAGRIIGKMRESARFRGFEHLLAEFFIYHPDTSKIAKEIEGFTAEDPYSNDLGVKTEDDIGKLSYTRRESSVEARYRPLRYGRQ